MKYIIVDQIKNGDCFTAEYNDKNEAIKAAQSMFDHLSDYDKRRRESLYVLESVNPDEESANHFDGNPVYELI